MRDQFTVIMFYKINPHFGTTTGVLARNTNKGKKGRGNLKSKQVTRIKRKQYSWRDITTREIMKFHVNTKVILTIKISLSWN